MPFSLTATAPNSIRGRECKRDSFTRRHPFSSYACCFPNGIQGKWCESTIEGLWSRCVLNKACCVWQCVCVCECEAVWMTDWSALAAGPVVILVPTHTPRFSSFRVIAAAATVQHFKCATNRPVIGCNERSDICPVPLLFPDKPSHSDTRRNTLPPPPSSLSAFIFHAKPANYHQGKSAALT